MKKINARLLRIANVLLINASFTKNLGLLNGKMGIAIFFYKYGRYANNELYGEIAGKLIDDIYEEINLSTNVGFSNGLMGIGWGIEYLVREGFLEANTDDVLKDLDNKIIITTHKAPLLINNPNELFGYGIYFLSRIKDTEYDGSNIDAVKNKQTLVYLHDDCERLLTLECAFGQNGPYLSLKQLNSILYFIIGMQRLRLYPVKLSLIEKAFADYIKKIIIPCQNITELNAFRSQLLKSIKYISSPKLQIEYREILTAVPTPDSTQDVAQIVNEFIKTSWYSLLYNLPGTSLNGDPLFAKKVFGIIDNEENWMQRLSYLTKQNLGLDGGMAGLGLAVLFGLTKEKK